MESLATPPTQELEMNRQKLLAILSALSLIATAACSDLTAPKNDEPPPPCPSGSGPDCKPL